MKDGIKSRLTESLELALKKADGLAKIQIVDGDEIHFSSNYACNDCGITLDEMTPRMFSFNSPYGACPDCAGLGTIYMMDPELAIPDWTLSINDGAITLGGWTNSSTGYAMGILRALGEKYGFTMEQPLNSLTEEQRQILLYGSNGETLTVTYTNDHGSGTYQVPYEA